MEFLDMIWSGLAWPLARLIFFVSLGLLVANLIESLNWTHGVAKLASPLVRLGHLSDTAGASFSLAFFSGVSANTMLAEAFDQGNMSKKELIFSNIFNSLPTYFLHLPTMFFIAVPLIKGTAFIYVGLTLFAAFLLTFIIIFVGRIFLPTKDKSCVTCQLDEEKTVGFQQALTKTWERFRRRIKRILSFTVPIYIMVFILNRLGMFDILETIMSRHLSLLSWLHPSSLGIVILQLTAELSAGLAAAGALLDGGSLPAREVVLALLFGNVISSPMRAVRHQFPYYAGIFNPRLAAELIIYNQSFRAVSMIFVTLGYYIISSG